MKVIFLCAGYATRLYPLTKDCPKALLEIAGRPILNYLMDNVLRIPSVSGILIVSNEKFFDAFSKWKNKFYSKENVCVLNDKTTTNENRLGAIRDIQFALKQEKVSEDVLVLASDNLFDSEIRDFVETAQKRGPHASVGVYDIKDIVLASRYGLVAHDQSGKITQFFEKPNNPVTTLASMGLYFFPKGSLQLINQYLKGNQNPDAPGHYIQWLVTNDQVFAFPFQGTWYDIGDHASYQNADRAFRLKSGAK